MAAPLLSRLLLSWFPLSSSTLHVHRLRSSISDISPDQRDSGSLVKGIYSPGGAEISGFSVLLVTRHILFCP